MGYHCNWCGEEFSHNPIIANTKVGQTSIQLHFCCEDCYAQGTTLFEFEFAEFSERQALQHLVSKLVLKDTT